jgi:MOSC domain-containing protein YiiM
MNFETQKAQVSAVSISPSHTFSKSNVSSIYLIEGHGVEGDAHAGATVKHRSRVAKDPSQPNLRQVHLIHAELFDYLHEKGYTVAAGQMGENITTSNLDLLALPKDAILNFPSGACVQITGLRNPCNQLNSLGNGMMKALLPKDEQGQIQRLAGIMGIVLKGGPVKPGDQIEIKLPQTPHQALERV